MNRVTAFFKALWQGWKKIAAKIAHVQGHILLGVIYIVILAPLGLLFRLFRQDPLAIRLLKRPSFWVRRTPIKSPETFLRKEF